MGKVGMSKAFKSSKTSARTPLLLGLMALLLGTDDCSQQTNMNMRYVGNFVTAPVKGIASTQGSPILRNNIPSADSLVVARMRRAGAVFIGKSNVMNIGFLNHLVHIRADLF